MLNTLLNAYNRHTSKIIFGTGLLIGLLLGLLVGWVLWPVSYTNATPEMLRVGDLRDEYLVLIAQDFELTGNIDQARLRLGVDYWRKEDPVVVLQELAAQRPQDALALMALADAISQAPPPVTPGEAAQEGEQVSLLQRIRPAFTICGIGLVVAALAGLVYLLLSRQRSRRAGRPGREAPFPIMGEPVVWDETTPPLKHFRTAYTLGDDFYDPSFSIEKENGDFMGECGVGISEVVGVGDPKKVTALEVWIFDKNDIRTVTKVLMSSFAMHDDALRTKLAAKGDPVLAQPNAELILETATLLMRARVTDMEYGQGQLPPESFFQRVALDIAVWVNEDNPPAAEL